MHKKKTQEEEDITALSNDITYSPLFKVLPIVFHAEVARRAKERMDPWDISMTMIQSIAKYSTTVSSNGDT